MPHDNMLLLGLAWSMVQADRTIPAIVWSLRCGANSAWYSCPPVFPQTHDGRHGSRHLIRREMPSIAAMRD